MDEIKIKKILSQAEKRFLVSDNMQQFKKKYELTIEKYQSRIFGLIATSHCVKEIQELQNYIDLKTLNKIKEANNEEYNKKKIEFFNCFKKFDRYINPIRDFSDNISLFNKENNENMKDCSIECFYDYENKFESNIEDCVFRCYNYLMINYEENLNNLIDNCNDALNDFKKNIL